MSIRDVMLEQLSVRSAALCAASRAARAPRGAALASCARCYGARAEWAKLGMIDWPPDDNEDPPGRRCPRNRGGRGPGTGCPGRGRRRVRPRAPSFADARNGGNTLRLSDPALSVVQRLRPCRSRGGRRAAVQPGNDQGHDPRLVAAQGPSELSHKISITVPGE